MEKIVPDNHNYLNINSKSQLYFGQNFSQKIQKLKVFIYGLKGVTKYHQYYSIIKYLII
jgi:hypothetical protein